MKPMKEQLPLDLDKPPQKNDTRQPMTVPRGRDTKGKPQHAGCLAKSVMQKLTQKNLRKSASIAFIGYQLLEMTISLLTTL